MSIFMPVLRAPGGRKERKRRAVFALGLNGLKTVFTSVMNLVIMIAYARLQHQSAAKSYYESVRRLT